MPGPAILDKPIAPRRCRKPGHSKHVKGCRACCDFSTYESRMRRWEKAKGITRSTVPAGPVRDHLLMLIQTGHLTIVDICRESGVSAPTVRVVLEGTRATLFQITAVCLLSVQPRSAPQQRPRKAGMVPRLEATRILRGLVTQGWSYPTIGDLLGGHERTAVQKLVWTTSPWMLPETLTRIRAVARELGPYDIRALDRPMPGMDVRSANNADRNNWAPLWAWEGRDLADPDAVPVTFGLTPAKSEIKMSFIDQEKIRRVQETAETVDSTTERLGQTTSGWIGALPRLTKLEAHAVAWFGEQAGLNSTHIGRLLGFRMQSGTPANSREKKTGQRKIARLNQFDKVARAWMTSDPAGETPDWFNPDPSSGKPNFGDYLPVLMAAQPAPYGAGWAPAELAKRCGATEDEMIRFLAVANREGNRRWQTRAVTPSRAKRHTETCSTRQPLEYAA